MGKFIKLIISVTIIGGLMYYFTGEEQSKEEEINEVIEYIETINLLNTIHYSLLEDYQKSVVDQENIEKSYTYLQKELIPKYKNYQKEVKKINPISEKVLDVHDTYDRAVQLQLLIFNEYVKAYKEQEEEVYESANIKVDENNALFEIHEKKIKALAKEFNLLLKKENN